MNRALAPLPEPIRSRLDDCDALPSLPAAVIRVLEVARRSEANLQEYAEAIEQDPALTLRLLSLANSVFHSPRLDQSGTCRDAVARIGLDATLAAVMSFALPRVTSRTGLDHDAIWQRAIVAALAARHLGRRLCPRHSATLFTIALLQDIGMLAAEALYGEAYSALVGASDNHDAICQAERERYGCDHARLGAWLALQWGVPHHLARGIAGSHGDLDAATPEDLCIRLSGTIADAWLSPAPARHLSALLRRLEGLEQSPSWSLDTLFDQLEQQLPDMAELMAITRPPQHDAQALLAEAQQHLYRQVLRLSTRLDAQQADLAELQARHEDLERRSRLDPLTGLANRAWLEEQLDMCFQTCSEQGQSLAVVFIDLDHFKRLNDLHGHRMGDRVLRNFASTLLESVREGDLAGRYGGEEFLVILEGERSNGAEAMAERLTQQLSRRPMAWLGEEPLHVSVSIGIAVLDDGPFTDPRELIDAADLCMYQAKRDGRGRFSRFTPPADASD